MKQLNIRRGLKRIWIVVSAVWVGFSVLVAGGPAYRSAKGLWINRDHERLKVEQSATAHIYNTKPPADVQAVHMRGPDGRTFWVEVKDKDAMWSAMYADLETHAMQNFTTLAWLTFLPLMLFWGALYTAAWVVRGFKT